MHPPHTLDRRTCLSLAAAPLLASAALLAPPAAQAQQFLVNVTAAQLKALKLKPDGIRVDFPPLADTGFSVPLQAEIQAPAGLKVQSVEVFLPENPHTLAIKLRLVEPQERYVFTTRLRLAGSQDAWVVATMTDGSQRAATAPTIITSSACFDGS